MRSLNRHHRRLFPLALIVLLPLASTLSAQEASELIVESDPEVRITLDGLLRIMPDGSVRAATSQQPDDFCPGSCVGVKVDLDSFTADGETTLSAYQGDTLIFNWQSLGARQCSSGGDLPDWNDGTPRDISGPTAIELDAERPAGNYSATLQCQNGSVPSNELAVSLEVLEFIGDPGAPEYCDATRQMPAAWTRLSQCENRYGWTSSNCNVFTEINPWESPFIEQNGVGADLGIKRANDYIAIAFSTAGLKTTATGSIQVNRPRSSAPFNGTGKLMSISTCPGDFNESAIMAETGCIRESFTQNLDWGGSSTDRSCKLQSDQIYYLNIVFTNSPVGTPTSEILPNPDCDEGSPYCGNSFYPSISN